MFEFDIDDEFEAFMREVHPHVAEHSTEYSVMRRVFYAGCTTIFHSFFMSNELAALSRTMTGRKTHRRRNAPASITL